jgi:hypothetical protein
MPDEKFNLKTTGLKLSELEPCNFCDGPLRSVFRVIEVKHAAVNARNANQTLAMASGFGFGLALAEVFSTGPGAEVLENAEAVTRLFCCQDCLCGDVNIAVACERVNERRAKKNQPKEIEEHAQEA